MMLNWILENNYMSKNFIFLLHKYELCKDESRKISNKCLNSKIEQKREAAPYKSVFLKELINCRDNMLGCNLNIGKINNIITFICIEKLCVLLLDLRISHCIIIYCEHKDDFHRTQCQLKLQSFCIKRTIKTSLHFSYREVQKHVCRPHVVSMWFLSLDSFYTTSSSSSSSSSSSLKCVLLWESSSFWHWLPHEMNYMNNICIQYTPLFLQASIINVNNAVVLRKFKQ